MTAVPSTPTILRATSSADFLAALPRLTGMSAPESCFVVMFDGKRTTGTVRIDLPERLEDQLGTPGPELEAWIRQVAELAIRSLGPVAVVIDTASLLTEQPAASPHGVLTAILNDVLQAGDVPVRDALVVGSDGWTSFMGTDQPELRSLDEIGASLLHDPSFVPAQLDEWRAEHPGRTAEGPEAIEALAVQMRGGQR
ncbi:DUF4192 family protein [Leucobacter luti]|uniref:Uncharacterized protein DUF4192 n=1 Tax=Leucobacter luti TaxID=340320 RepID=A0A4Q7U0U5_9MICO|nr:DUF4192 family protein [Leucobacter luti]MBL3698992.1 DUF4192 family protein [Leucobacter luti]RZT66370.1 uncharacterized protein DUF4192 [Leucobacter luti]